LKKILLAAVLPVVAMLVPHPAYAWSNGGFSSDPSHPKYGTHDWIAQRALDWLPDEEKQFILGNLNLYLYGTELPDKGKALGGIGDTTFDSSGEGLTCVWMDRNYDWSNPTFRNRCGESLNLAVNYLADLLHTLWLEAGKPIPEFAFNIAMAIILPAAILIAVAVLRIRLLHKRNPVA